MELIDYITLAVFAMIGMVIGWKASARFHISMFKQLLADLGVTNQQLIKVARNIAATLGVEAQEKIREIEAEANGQLDQIEIKVEKHGDMLYAFRKDNDQFLGQGLNREALVEAMKLKMNNVRLTVVEGAEYMKIEA